MKTKHFLFTALAGALLLGLPHSCKKPTEGVNLIIKSQFSAATASFQFVDAVSGEQIGLTNSSEVVSVTVNGPDANLIVDNAANPNLSCELGFITLALQRGIVPSASNQVNFHIEATAPGYLSNTVSVVISESGTQHHIVKMVKVTNTPDGIAAVVNNSLTATSGGVTQAPFTLTTPAVVTTFENTGATITIPSGTTLLDKDMLPVPGTITATMVYFNNQDESALSAYPGGFTALTATGTTVFKTGGMVSMQMRNGGGKEVKNFGSSVQMTMQIPSNTTNDAGATVQNGMVIPVWSFDPETGQWTMESQSTITFNGGTGKFEVTFTMDHLSYWSLNWNYPGFCGVGAAVDFTSAYTSPKYAYVALRHPNGDYYNSGYANIASGNSLRFLNAPSNKPFVLSVYTDYDAYLQNQGAQTINIANLCSGSYPMSLTSSSPVSVTVQVNASCADRPTQIIRPTLTVYGKKSGSSTWFYVGEMIDGRITTSALALGETYHIGTMLGGEFIESDNAYTVNELEYSIDQLLDPVICDLIE